MSRSASAMTNGVRALALPNEPAPAHPLRESLRRCDTQDLASVYLDRCEHTVETALFHEPLDEEIEPVVLQI